MKTLVIILGVMMSFLPIVSAQVIIEKDGSYFVNSKPYTGEYTTFHENGNVKMEATFVNGKKDGECRIYFENGELNEIRSYRMNEMHGNWVTFNIKGIKIAQAGYNNGKKDGKWFIWNDDGQLLYELSYTDGQKSGIWKNYNELGVVTQERAYTEM